jgi:hypothetical protein
MENHKVTFSEFEKMLSYFGHDNEESNVIESMSNFKESFNSDFNGKDETGNILTCDLLEEGRSMYILIEYSTSHFFTLGDIETYISGYFEEL